MIPSRYLHIMAYCFVMLAIVRGEEEEGADAHWGYEPNDGPSEWCSMLPKDHCCGHRQSPVNIITKETISMPDSLEFHNYKYFASHSTVTNNGKSAMVQMHGMEKTPYLRINSHLSRFMLDSFHFHWGSEGQNGSEHTMDDRRFPLEMHVVHTNSRYKSLTEARDYFNGLTVLSVLFEVSDEDNADYDMLIKTLSEVKAEGSHANIKRNFSVTSILPQQFKGLYAYKGSLTTPPCSESVTWFIFDERVTISYKQIDQFRKLQAETMPSRLNSSNSTLVLERNFRPLQPLNGRYIYRLKADLTN